jgi:zinc/manganese transport system substrate-binding protein
MIRHTLLALTFLVAAAHGRARADEAPPPLKVCATVPDLGDLARQVGGEDVAVTVFARGPEDPHFMEARPSFLRELSRADLFILVGLDLEIGWAPSLWQNARNGRVLPGTPGFLDASTAIKPLDIPAGLIDRAMGDVHPYGNPHYLLDPVNGLKVARAIRDRLTTLRPAKKETFSGRYEAFAKKLHAALAGEQLAAKYDAEKLAVLAEHGKLEGFLKEQGQSNLLGGWLGRLAPFRGGSVVADHNLWPYFAARFGLKVAGFFEPKPGIPPTTAHLTQLVGIMQAQNVRAVLTVPYFDRRHAAFVAEKTGARIAAVVHQSGAAPDAGDYLAMVEHNVREVERALRAAP